MWCGLSRDERICKNCDEGEVEDDGHLLLQCTCTVEERQQMERLIEYTAEG